MPYDQLASRKAVGRRLAELRGDRTQKDFADLLGIGRTSLIRYEAGERPIDTDLVSALFVLFRVDVLWLLTGTEAASSAWGHSDEMALIDRYRSLNKRARDHVVETVKLLSDPGVR